MAQVALRKGVRFWPLLTLRRTRYEALSGRCVYLAGFAGSFESSHKTSSSYFPNYS